MRVIKQCEIDSLVKRSLPIGFGFGFGTFWAIQKGVLKVSKYINDSGQFDFSVFIWQFALNC